MNLVYGINFFPLLMINMVTIYSCYQDSLNKDYLSLVVFWNLYALSKPKILNDFLKNLIEFYLTNSASELLINSSTNGNILIKMTISTMNFLKIYHVFIVFFHLFFGFFNYYFARAIQNFTTLVEILSDRQVLIAVINGIAGGPGYYQNFIRILKDVCNLKHKMSPLAINEKYPRKIHEQGKHQFDQTTCSICQEDYKEFVRTLGCGHVFHDICIDQVIWSDQLKCPLCQVAI